MTISNWEAAAGHYNRSMERVRWGIVGTGRMASTIAAEIAALREHGIDLIAVASRDADRAREFATRFGARQWVGDPAGFATLPLDAVYVATPHVQHAEQMLASLRAGQAVLCEKPFTLNAAQAEEVVNAAIESRVFAMEAMWTRFLPAVVALRELLAAGAIGPVRMITGGGAFIPDGSQPGYLLDPALGGGVLLDAGVYLVSLASMILGTPTSVLAQGVIGATGVDEQVSMLMSYPGGAQAQVYVSMRARRSPDLEILGETGRIRIAAPVFRPARLTLWSRDGTESVRDYPIDGTGYGYQIHAVSAALRRGERECAAMPLAESLSIMRTLDEVRRQIGLQYPSERTPTENVHANPR